MHPGRWFNETAFDSVDYLVPALLLFVLAAAKWAWRYWHRETLRARRIVLSLLTIGAGCLLLWVVLGSRPAARPQLKRGPLGGTSRHLTWPCRAGVTHPRRLQ